MNNSMADIKKESDEYSDKPYYKYGTSISLDGDMMDELKLEDLKVGDRVEVRAIAVVDSKSEHSNEEGSDKNISLQFVKVHVKREDPDHATTLYGD